MWYIQALPGKTSHFGSRDKVKVFFSLRVKKRHCLHSCIIGSHPENLIRRYVRLKCCKQYVKHVVGFVKHLKGMISSWGNPGAIPSTFPPWVGSYKSPPTLSFEHLISQDWIFSTKLPACQDEASPQGLCPRCRSWLRRPSELSRATAPEIQQVRHLGPGNENFTSVGPAYIMGLGKIAMTVDSLSSSPSSSTALCCSILTARGTSSSLVQPPRGCSSRTGRLYPLDSNCRLWKVSLIKENTTLYIWFPWWKHLTYSRTWEEHVHYE